MMNSTMISKLRHLTQPERTQSSVFTSEKAGVALQVALVTLAVVLGIAAGQYLVLGAAVAIYVAARALGDVMVQKHGMFGLPIHICRWVIPAAAVLAVAVGPISTWAAMIVLAAAAAGSMLWDWNPWVRSEIVTAQATAGWGSVIPRHLAFPYVMASAMQGLTRIEERQRWVQYQPELRKALDNLGPEWEVNYDRLRADALAVGPGGVVGIYSVSMAGHLAMHIDNFQDDSTMREAQGAVRLHPILQSEASHAVTARMDEFESELIGENGEDLGDILPVAPVQFMSYLASKLAMPAQQTPVTLLVAHGLEMDKRWGRVHLRDEQGQWMGAAIVCHPRFVRECLTQLPGAFSSAKQIAGAQVAVDLRTR